jgi:hypothetical protein
MHLFMQDDQIGRKFMGLSPSDQFNEYKKMFLVVNDLVRQLGLHLLYKGNCPFLTTHSHSSS